jgi:plastocyanin
MVIRTLPVVILLAGTFAIVAACGHSPAAPSPDSAASIASPSIAPGAASAPSPQMVTDGRTNIMVNMHDACEPDSFNAAAGPGTCVRNGGVLFDNSIAQLTANQFVGAWHFAPGVANARVGETFLASNTGGEVHTFTEVADFGGGIVPPLNQLSGNPNVAPECTALEADDFVAPGQTYHETVDHAGTVKFQCCIHPWMRLVATVK